MFVAQGAKELLLEHRKEGFVDQYMLPLIQEAEKLGISEYELVDLLKQLKGRDKK